MATDWYVATDGNQKGPLSTSELKRWIEEGKLAGDSLVKQGPNGPWRTVGELNIGGRGQSLGQLVLNLIGITALVVIGGEIYLFLRAHTGTVRFAPVAAGLYAMWVLYNGPRWLRRTPGEAAAR